MLDQNIGKFAVIIMTVLIGIGLCINHYKTKKKQEKEGRISMNPFNVI
jgi:hypothetical protein